ncbi:MAG: tetratricopeptide repeat protein [Chitinophagales bacterium]|nr:tetratricopeptide repeat protein [Chitinophagales bacterium]
MRKIVLPCCFLLISICSFAQENTEQSLAFQYYRDGEYEKAAGLLSKLYEKDQSPAIYRYLYNSLLYIRDYEGLEKMVRKNIKKNPDNPTYLVDLGYFYNQQGNLSKGKEEYNNAIKLLKPNGGVIVQLAGAFINYNENDLAAKTYEKGRELLGDPGAFSLELASIYEKQNNPQKTIENYLSYFDQNPGNDQSVKNLLQNVVQQKAFADELHIQLLSRAQKYPDAVYYNELLIWHYVQQKNFKGAIIQAKALDKRQKENGYRLMNIARSALAEKEYEPALEAFQYVLDKGKGATFYMKAREEMLGVYKQKIINSVAYTPLDLATLDAEFDKFIEEFGVNSATANAIKEKAELQAFYLNNYEKAISLLDNLISNQSIEPRVKGELKLLLGDFYIMKGEIWEAALLYGQVDKGFKDEPLGELARFKNAKLSYYRGEFEWAQAQLDVLKSATTELISNDAIKLSVFIMDNLGLDTTLWPMLKFAEADLYFYQNKTDAALNSVDSVLRVFPDHTLTDDIYFMKANIALKKQDYQTAAGFFEKIIQQYPDELLGDDATYKLAELNEFTFNDKEKAKQLYQDLLFKYKDSIYLVEARKRFRALRGDQL